MIQLYSYWRSSAAYRVRIALGLKGLEYETIPVHLVKDGGEHKSAAYAKLNPQQLVPTLVHDGVVIGQSLAIMEYLDEVFPDAPLLPKDAAARARTRQMAMVVAMEIHPVNNLGVMQYLVEAFGADDAQKLAWTHRWMKRGFDALEVLADNQGPYLAGAQVTMADCCLIPQLYNAHRFNFPLGAYPKLRRVEQACNALNAFKRAAPEVQVDAA